MFKNKALSWILFVIGILLQELSYMAEIWIIRVLGGVLWPIGMVMIIYAMIANDQKKRSDD